MPLQLINFFFVKPKFRVLYVSMVTLFYDFGFIYLLRHVSHLLASPTLTPCCRTSSARILHLPAQ